MNAHVEYVETAADGRIKEAQQKLGSALLQSLLLEIRALPDCWQKMSEDQQAESLDHLCRAIDTAVTAAIVTLAAGEMATIRAEVERVTFKDGVKAVFTVQKDSPYRHDLADAQGNNVLIVLEDIKSYTASARDVKPDPNQRPLKDLDGGMPALEHQA